MLITQDAISEMSRLCQSCGLAETGGILIGNYSQDHRTAFINRVTGPPNDSQHYFANFVRGVRGLQDLLNKLWSQPEKQYYIGEWHYHPLPILNPSGEDVRQMQTIALSGAYACPEPILIIVGGSTETECRFSVTIHPMHEKAISLLRVPLSSDA